MDRHPDLEELVRFIGPEKGGQLAQLVHFPTAFRIMHARRELRRAMHGFRDSSFWFGHLDEALNALVARFPPT